MTRPFNRLAAFVLTATSAAVLLGLASAAPATAEIETSRTVALFTRVDGKPLQLDGDDLTSHALDLTAPVEEASDSVSIAPRLIDWNQWFGCYSLNTENDVFADYMFWWDGYGHDVRLKCGNSSWGYKHIREDKEGGWQSKLDSARAAGWQASALGVESWDDLMSGATGAIILYPDYLRKDAINNKWCANNEFYLQDVKTGRELYSFRVEAAWASDSDRLITSFPTSRTYC
ncbi:hypothetical protein [Leifsonia sp. RAF41]|uniref:hypothetical protein n=1 Tax=Leifsonia sp. RAF41 TaxID=3233056 RepID=UPI003F94E2C4